MGLLGSYFPEEYGGAGLDVALLRYRSRRGFESVRLQRCFDFRTYLTCQRPYYTFGTEEQKEEMAPCAQHGEKIGCFLLTEPNAGSDAGGTTTMYTREGDEFVINGGKIFITNGGYLGPVCCLPPTTAPSSTKGSVLLSLICISRRHDPQERKQDGDFAAATPPPSPLTTCASR